MSGEIPSSANERARNSTIGVLPLPPHVKFPTLITGTGNLNQYKKKTQTQLQNPRKRQSQQKKYISNKNLVLGHHQSRQAPLRKNGIHLFSFPLRISNRLPVFLDDFEAVELVAGEGSE